MPSILTAAVIFVAAGLLSFLAIGPAVAIWGLLLAAGEADRALERMDRGERESAGLRPVVTAGAERMARMGLAHDAGSN